MEDILNNITLGEIFGVKEVPGRHEHEKRFQAVAARLSTCGVVYSKVSKGADYTTHNLIGLKSTKT
jgi:hypothetical protein